MSFLKKSPWMMHYDASSCNGCDIEILACLTPLYDVERFGVINTGNPKHADILLVSGSVNEQNKQVLQNIFSQMSDPKVVVAVGICATSGGVFKECYNVMGGIDKILPVDVYVPGCAARPESIIDGVLQALTALEQKHKEIKESFKNIKNISIEVANINDAEEILSIQRLAYRTESEIYNDPALDAFNQTLESLKEDFVNMTVLKATINGKIIGSVRGYIDNDDASIKRLIVFPKYQNKGIGTKLVYHIEKILSSAERYVIYTGHKSKRNIYLYKKLGYEIFRTEKFSEKINWVYMSKTRS